jgi:hypothetical protein
MGIKKSFVGWLTRDAPASGMKRCDFQALQQHIRPGDVLLVEGRSRVSSVIKAITQSAWSHVALYIGRLDDIEDPILRKKVVDALGRETSEHLLIEGLLGKGMVVSPLSDYQEDHLRICHPKGLSYDDTKKVVAYAINALGTPYHARHILDLARFFLPWSLFPKRWASSLFRPYEDVESEICSSMIAKAFQSVHFPIMPYVLTKDDQTYELIPRNARLYVPCDFDYSPYFEIIKYQMLNVGIDYRNLPWTAEDYIHNDDGEVYKARGPLH